MRTTDFKPMFSKGNTRKLSKFMPRYFGTEYGFELTELERSSPYLVGVLGDRKIIVASTAFTFPSTFKKPEGKQERKDEPSSVHGLNKKYTAKFDAVLARFPDHEGWYCATVSYGTSRSISDYERTRGVMAPVDEIRKHSETGIGRQFTLGWTNECLKWDFRQSSPTVPGSMFASVRGSEVFAAFSD